jgi:hypothetical protein
LISERQYGVIPQNSDFDFSKQSPLSKGNVVTELNRANIHNAIRRWLNQFQEAGCGVAAIKIFTPKMLDNIWREIEYSLDMSGEKKDAHV